MAQAARQEQAETGSDIVRRLVARPLRLRIVDNAPVVTTPMDVQDTDAEADDDLASDVMRLTTEVTLMKAVLKAERREIASLRSQIEMVGGATLPIEDLRHVRDSLATLVNQFIRQPR